ncbi:MAG TPA: hypothetical protein VMY77_16220 [Chitinophagaceae bacterium]|nr:hypothetical protein [Chitinophagaceae bacterium]
MLRNLILPLGIYRLRTKMHAIESRIKKMESLSYLDLQGRKEVAQMKKTLALLHEQEAAFHFSLSL